MFVTPATQRFTVCLQDAEAPYGQLSRTAGELPDDDPAPDEAAAMVGSGSDEAAALVGVAGADVARVEVTTADGTRVDADLSDGYWVAWGTDLEVSDRRVQAERDAGPWDGATLTWYGADDVELGSEPPFG